MSDMSREEVNRAISELRDEWDWDETWDGVDECVYKYPLDYCQDCDKAWQLVDEMHGAGAELLCEAIARAYLAWRQEGR